MLNENDLKFFPYDEGLLTLLTRMKPAILYEIVKSWFESDRLRPLSPESTFAEYHKEKSRLSKKEMIQRITETDWPTGLYACQVAQLSYERMAGLKRNNWRAIRLSNDDENIKLHLDMEAIKNGIQEYVSKFLFCYIYSFRHVETDTFIFVLCVSEEQEEDISISDINFSYMIYFPETEYVVTPKFVWLKDMDGYFKEALLATFGASKMISETTDVNSISQLKKSIEARNSKGILGQLRKNTLDNTPLDIRQKRPREFDEFYVNAGEQRKRIVPIDMEEMKARYEALDENFGWDQVDGSKSLEIDLELPLNAGKDNSLREYDDDIVEISMLIEGTNVAEGVRKSIIAGKIDTPAPVWLEALAVNGLKKIKLHPDGVVENLEEEKTVEE